MKNISELVEWIILNPELAKRYYPELMQGLTERIKNSEPFLTAIIIQKLPDHFPKWKTDAEQYFGIKRTKTIQGYIKLINTVLTEYEYPTEIEQKAVESVKAELTEQLKYWRNELKALPPHQTKTITEQTNRPTIKAYAIMHVYLAMFNGQPVTQQNKNILAKEYCYKSGDQLRNDFTLYQYEDKRLELNTGNKRSANTHLKRFEDILPLLKSQNTQAYEKANKDYLELKNKYNKYY